MKQVTQYMIEAMGLLHKAQERVNELKAQGQEVENDFELTISNLLITATTLRQVAMGITMPTGYGAAVGGELRNTDVAHLPQVEFIQGDTQGTESKQTSVPYSYPMGLSAEGNSERPTSPLLFSYPVVRDRFYAGEYPGAKDEEQARAKITEMVDFGIGVFIDLTEVGELEPYAHLLPSWATHERYSLPDESVPPRSRIHQEGDQLDQPASCQRKDCLPSLLGRYRSHWDHYGVLVGRHLWSSVGRCSEGAW
jgi:hypothetical protein